MLTPQEVAQRSFGKASFGGYNMAMVDDFLDELTADYETLFNENALLKQKLGVLSGKIREYQSTEESMRKAFLAAQQMSDKLVKETEEKCAAMLSQAESTSAAKQQELTEGLGAEEQKLQAAQRAVEQYKAQIRAVCQKQMDYLDRLDQVVVPAIPKVEDRTVEDIQAAVERCVAQEDEELRAAEVLPETVPPFEGPAPIISTEDHPTQPLEATIEHAPRRLAPDPDPMTVEESSVSLYEQLMAQRRGDRSPTTDDAPTRRIDRRTLEFGKDFEID